jgi:hypothetical protein
MQNTCLRHLIILNVIMLIVFEQKHSENSATDSIYEFRANLRVKSCYFPKQH